MPASKIRVLDEQTINKIAAGEVIENPASVVKELLENALDAGATDICVEIKGGGRQLIRISDNGCGMTKDDALLCLERHATSKIKQVEDIQQLFTMGFRGEALPSIASISKFVLLTHAKEEVDPTKGTLITVEGGNIIHCTAAVRSPGTTIEVKSLFFNVPVRKKFQKSPSYDTQEILKVLTLLSLSHPLIAFELISDQKTLLKMPPLIKDETFLAQLGQRIESVLGKDFFHALCPLALEQNSYRLEGYIGLPSCHRHNRTGQYLFINDRAVTSPLLGFAVREGYGTMLPTQRYPLFVLHLHMPGTLVDVNVHPQKKEVRLRQEQKLKEWVTQAVQEALSSKNFQEDPLELSSPFPFAFNPKVSAPFSFKTDPFSFKLDEELDRKAYDFSSTPLPHTFYENVLTEPTQQVFSFPTQPQQPQFTLLATIPGYILIDLAKSDTTILDQLGLKQKEGLCLVDQRAAYARLYYERLLKRLEQTENGDTYIQPLLFPLTVEFTRVEASALKDNLSLLRGMGFVIEEFGECTFIVQAIPDLLSKENLQSCLSAITHDFLQLQDRRYLQREKEKQIVWTACQISLPANKRLSIEEAHLLIQQLMLCDMPNQSPLGKPTTVVLSTENLRQLF